MQPRPPFSYDFGGKPHHKFTPTYPIPKRTAKPIKYLALCVIIHCLKSRTNAPVLLCLIIVQRIFTPWWSKSLAGTWRMCDIQ